VFLAGILFLVACIFETPIKLPKRQAQKILFDSKSCQPWHCEKCVQKQTAAARVRDSQLGGFLRRGLLFWWAAGPVGSPERPEYVYHTLGSGLVPLRHDDMRIE